MSSSNSKNRPGTDAPNGHCVLSITTDRQAGGIANALVSYSTALAAKGHHHIIILPSSAVIIPTLKQIKTVCLITLSPALIKFHLLTRGLFASAIRTALAQADVFFLHNSLLLPRLSPTDRPCFLVNHSGKTRHLNRADHIIFLTQVMRNRTIDKLPQLASHPDRLHVLPHGFVLNQTSKTTQPTTIEQEPPILRVVSAGRFVEKKGFSVLIAAAKLCAAAGIPCQMDIFGEGPLKASLQNQITQSSLTSVSLKSWSDDLSRVFADADLFCSPSLDEPFGLVIGEAMAMGLPVIAAETDGAVELLGQQASSGDTSLQNGGLIVPKGDVEALAAAISRFYADAKLRHTAGQNARKRIETHFTHAHLADRLDQLLRTMSPLSTAERSYI